MARSRSGPETERTISSGHEWAGSGRVGGGLINGVVA